MPPILCWPKKPEADVGVIAVEAEPSHQYSVTCCCCVTDGSRGALWQNSIWNGNVHEAKVCHWILLHSKNGMNIHWQLLNVYGVDVSTVRGEWCISAVVTVTWKTNHVLDSHAQSMAVSSIHSYQLMVMTMLKTSVLQLRIYSIKQCYTALCIVSLVRNSRHYFQSHLIFFCTAQ